MLSRSSAPSRTISSSMTFFFKFVFPTVWISGFGAGALATVLSSAHVPDSRSVLFMWVIGSLFLLWGCAPLKRVRLVGSNVCVSNYLKEICIPADRISQVTENRWINIHPVTIHFREETPFGQTIRFMPHT